MQEYRLEIGWTLNIDFYSIQLDTKTLAHCSITHSQAKIYRSKQLLRTVIICQSSYAGYHEAVMALIAICCLLYQSVLTESVPAFILLSLYGYNGLDETVFFYAQ